MKIVIFGATGMVGTELVKQALYNGHSVKAFGRNVFTGNLPKDDKLELVQGALFDAGQVRQAIKDCDAVLSALGGAINGTDVTRSLGMKNIVEQMQETGVNRIIGIGGLGILNYNEIRLLMDQKDFPPVYLPVSIEHKKALEYLQNSKLQWTFVCPPEIINAPATGVFHTKADYPASPNNLRINVGDLALFMFKELQQDQYLQHRVGISN